MEVQVVVMNTWKVIIVSVMAITVLIADGFAAAVAATAGDDEGKDHYMFRQSGIVCLLGWDFF